VHRMGTGSLITPLSSKKLKFIHLSLSQVIIIIIIIIINVITHTCYLQKTETISKIHRGIFGLLTDAKLSVTSCSEKCYILRILSTSI
jgi:hypothetical protein